jgi:hypothetical protein
MWPSILLALNLVLPAAAATWTTETWALVADRDDYSFRVLMNPDNVGVRESFVSAWVMYDFSTPQTNDSASGERYLSEKSLWIFDCPSGRTTMVSFIRYSRNFGEGQAVDSASAPALASRMEYFPKDSVANDQINAVCGVWRKRQSTLHLQGQSMAGGEARAQTAAR